MFTLIRCESCGGNPVGKGATSITVKVDVPQPRCESCGHADERDRTYNFCGSDCLLKLVALHGGFPCNMCVGSGHDKLNNMDCIYCKGAGRFGTGHADLEDPLLPI